MQNKIKLMILDDEPTIVDFIQKIFELEGFETFGAKNSTEALAIFNEHHPEICILDIYLIDSELNGIQVLEKIKKQRSETTCIMFTRITNPKDVADAGQFGAFEFLLKPLNPETLRNTVASAAEQIMKKSNG